MFSLVCFLLSAHKATYIFPNLNDNMYVDNTYDIKWNENNITNLNIVLLHRDINSYLGDSVSVFENGNMVLNDNVNTNNYSWTIPRGLNYYNLENHYFKFLLTNKFNLVSNSLDNKDKGHFVISDYFRIITNMNITNPNKNNIIKPMDTTMIKWNGFQNNIDINLQYIYNSNWLNIYNSIKPNLINASIYNNSLWNINDDINNYAQYPMRIKITETKSNIIRYSEQFKSVGITFNYPNTHLYSYNYQNYTGFIINWNKYNFIDNNITIELFDYNDDYIMSIIKNVIISDNNYIWNIPLYLFNNDYKLKISYPNSGINRYTNLFRLNYLTTTTDTTSTTTDTTSTTTDTTSTTTDTTSTTTDTTSTTTDTTSTTTDTTSTTTDTTSTTTDTTSTTTDTTSTTTDTTSTTTDTTSTTTDTTSTTTDTTSTTTDTTSTTTDTTSTTTDTTSTITDTTSTITDTTSTITDTTSTITDTTSTITDTTSTITDTTSTITNTTNIKSYVISDIISDTSIASDITNAPTDIISITNNTTTSSSTNNTYNVSNIILTEKSNSDGNHKISYLMILLIILGILILLLVFLGIYYVQNRDRKCNKVSNIINTEYTSKQNTTRISNNPESNDNNYNKLDRCNSKQNENNYNKLDRCNSNQNENNYNKLDRCNSNQNRCLHNVNYLNVNNNRLFNNGVYDSP